MATLTSASATLVNKMNRAAQKAGLGSEVRRLGLLLGSSGSITSAGSEVNLTLGITQSGYIVQARRSGSAGSLPLYVTSTAGNLKVSSASGVAPLASGDVITWIAFE